MILSAPGIGYPPLAWTALAPLTAALWFSASRRAGFFYGWVAGFLFYCGLLYWLFPTIRAGGLGPGLAAGGVALLSALLALEFGLFGLLGRSFRRAGVSAFPFALAALWTLIEWAKVLLTDGGLWFPWFLLAYTQWPNERLIQIVSLTGPWGLSFALAFSGTLIGSAFFREVTPGRKLRRLGWVLGIAGFLWLFGNGELKKADALPAGRTVKAAALQPCIDFYRKWDESYAGEIKRRLGGLAAEARAVGAGLVIWPENALPGWIDDAQIYSWLTSVSSGTYSLVGSVSRGDGRYVAAFLIGPDGRQESFYNKRKLVPFGEYIPLSGIFGGALRTLGALGEFSAGTRFQGLMEYEGVKLSAGICYESVFPYLSRADALKGADLLVNMTNDGWYLDTAGPHQHFAVNVFRAAENRRPMLRAANNGISVFIDPWGRVTHRLDLDEPGVLAAEVAAPELPPSFYARNGDWFAWLCLTICAAFLLAVFFL